MKLYHHHFNHSIKNDEDNGKTRNEIDNILLMIEY